MSVSNITAYSSSVAVSTPISSSPPKSLIEAIASGDTDRVASLLRSGANPNEVIHRYDRSRESLITPLYEAIEKGDPELVDLLLKAGAIPENGSISSFSHINFTKTPLYLAISQGNVKLVELLLNAGAQPNLTAYKQEPESLDNNIIVEETPLLFAISQANDKIVALLLQHGADANQKMRDNIPLFCAIERGHDEIISLLLRHGADANQKTLARIDECVTPLFQAIRRGSSERCIRLLLLSKADPFTPLGRDQDLTPMDLAIEKDKRSLIGLLLAGNQSTSQINVNKLIEKSNSVKPIREISPSKIKQFNTFDEAITIPHDKVTIKTRFVSSSLHEIVKECIDAVYITANPFVTPIAGYLDKAVKEKQPHMLRFIPGAPGEAEVAHFDPKTKDILIRIFDSDDINASIKNGKISSDDIFPTYVHENYHAMLDAVGLTSDVDFIARLRLAAEADAFALKKRNWPCDPVIKHHLDIVTSMYSDEASLQEYIVRVPQMIIQLQQKHKCAWQEASALVEKALPNLYQLIEKVVLPRFNANFE